MPCPEDTTDLADLINLPAGKIALLPIDLLAAPQGELDHAGRQLMAANARFSAALEVRYATRAAETRRACSKDTGTVRLVDGDYTIVADLTGRQRKWTDCLIHAVFAEPGVAEGFPHRELGGNEVEIYGEVATGIVWRALSILAQAAEVKPRTISPTLSGKSARPGVRGWTWHQIMIDPERLRAKSAPQGGTHASPRWHVRRGHWRRLADGRRVFVRQCQVGDPARGGVVKDYIVKGRAA